MTEFRRASSAVDSIVSLVEELATEAGTLDGNPSKEIRSKFNEVQRQLEELGPIADKMKRKCQARADLEVVKAQLREGFPGTSDDVMKFAQEMVDSGRELAPELKTLMDQALELEGLATYGSKMVERVLDLLGKLTVARDRFDNVVVPRLGAAVSNADASDQLRQVAAEREAAAAAAAEVQRAAEEARKPLIGLMTVNEQRLRQLQEAQDEAERRRAAKEEEQRRAAVAQQAEYEALQRAEEEGERRLAEIGADAACCEALTSMLASPVGKYREVVEALSGMLGGVAAEPADARLRLVRAGNEAFQETLGRRPGVWLFLRGVGFEPRARESLPVALLSAFGMGPGLPTERFLWLQEPDMFNAYEQWLAWHERIKGIAAFLQGLERLAFHRIAHLGQHGLDVATHTVLAVEEVCQRWNTRGGT